MTGLLPSSIHRMFIVTLSVICGLTLIASIIKLTSPSRYQTPIPAVNQSFNHMPYEQSAHKIRIPSLQEYVLIWSDEFNSDSIETKSSPTVLSDFHSSSSHERRSVMLSNWNIELGCGTHNNELQCYTDSPSNIYIDDGCLHITALSEVTTVRTPFQFNETTIVNNQTIITSKQGITTHNFTYTSARLTTQSKHEFVFSRIQARMKLPLFTGSWPAFWMIGSSISRSGWPMSGEIDIVEMINDEEIVHSTIHYDSSHRFDGRKPKHSQLGAAHLPAYKSRLDDQFHVYELIHTNTHLMFLLDGQLFYLIDIASNPVLKRTFVNEDNPFFLVLNLAIGGDWPGFEIDQEALPSSMIVDWVRVYEHLGDRKGHQLFEH